MPESQEQNISYRDEQRREGRRRLVGDQGRAAHRGEAIRSSERKRARQRRAQHTEEQSRAEQRSAERRTELSR